MNVGIARSGAEGRDEGRTEHAMRSYVQVSGT